MAGGLYFVYVVISEGEMKSRWQGGGMRTIENLVDGQCIVYC